MRRLLENFVWGATGEIQSMLLENGKVLQRGTGITASDATLEPCHNRKLYPAFVDAHCHILPTGLDLLKLQLEDCCTREEVLDTLGSKLPQIEPGAWLLAVHYDQTKFPDSQHITRFDLDKISSQIPILVRHVSGHASVANSPALQAANVSESTPNPPGGEFCRDESGHLTGVITEDAHERVWAASPSVNNAQMLEAILAASEKMEALGIGAAADMMTGAYHLENELNAYRIASDSGAKVRFRLYLQWSQVFGPRALPSSRLKELMGQMKAETCKVAGIKIFADGAIGPGTAAIYGKFVGKEGDANDQGQLIYAPDRLKSMVVEADRAGYQVAIHSIGDRSTDHVLDALEATSQPSRHRIEHAILLSDQQIERIARLGCSVCMQPEFLLRFGHAYRKQLGTERASQLKRFRSILDAAIPLSLSSDRPIVSGDPHAGVKCAVDRPAGFIPSENLTPNEALHGYTQAGANVMGDGELFGSLEPGQFSDLRWE